MPLSFGLTLKLELLLLALSVLYVRLWAAGDTHIEGSKAK
jgi:hypothetical protein